MAFATSTDLKEVKIYQHSITNTVSLLTTVLAIYSVVDSEKASSGTWNSYTKKTQGNVKRDHYKGNYLLAIVGT